MSGTIQDALYTALSSLDVAQHQINVISGNVANASTPGYVQQDLPQSEQASGGVVAEAIQRLTNAAAAASANQATGAQAYSQEMVNVLTPYLQTVGQASNSSSLPSELSSFSGALTTLSSAPNDATAQTEAVTSAQTVVDTFHSLDAAVANAREQADQGVAADVASVNATLDQLAQNQQELQKVAASGGSTASYRDTQDQLIASLSKQLPVKVLQNGSNDIIVTTDQGTTLFDGKVNHLAFTATANIPNTMRLDPNTALGQTGGLGTVTVGGQPLAMSDTGSIAADLQLRDVTLPGFADQLDQVAGNLITGFQAADPTVTTADPTGLFTAGGAALSSAGSVSGLAGTIALNAAVDPEQGGSAALIQTGMHGAPSSSTASDNSTILAFAQALRTPQSYTTATGLGSATTLMDAASQTAGLQQATLSNWTGLNTMRTTQAQTATTALSSATGVNVDDQLQKLMIVQQTYAASAQVMQTAATMLDGLIGAVQRS